MSVTYTENRRHDASATADAFVPRYAQAKRTKKGPKTWMILAPIGAVVLVGAGLAMTMGGSETQPLSDSEAAAPMTQPMASMPAPLENSAAPAALATPAAAPAPMVSEPATAPVVERRAAPVERSAQPAPSAAPRETVALEPTGPRPYTASPATSALNSATPAPAATPAPTPTPPAPAIQPAPLV